MQMMRNVAVFVVLAFVMTGAMGQIGDVTRPQNGTVPEPMDYYLRVMANRTSCDEPCTVHFWVEWNDPNLFLFRWDLNGDGEWDYPPQYGGGSLGIWTTDWFLDHIFYDDYEGKVCVEAWDGISTKTVTYNGTALDGSTAVDGLYYYPDTGWKFTPKVSMTVTGLGFWRWNYTYPDLSIRLYSASTGILLASCTPGGSGGNYWDWCNLVSPVALSASLKYILACHKSSYNQPPWTWMYPSRVSWDYVTYEGTYYQQGSSWLFVSNSSVPKCDLNFKVTKTEADASNSCLECNVSNVAPRVSLSSPAATATATLRIAGEKWHDVSAYLVEGGNETLVATLLRQPGKPQEASFPVTVDPAKERSLSVRYTPDDDQLNGQWNGATPASLTLAMDTGENRTFKHTFNARHRDTWEWTVGLGQAMAGRNITIAATATDAGADDLTFTWDWGGGSPAVVSFYPGGGACPFTATDTQTHEYAVAGTYSLKVTVNDDDGAEAEVVIILNIR